MNEHIKETIEGNKLIAEFIGERVYKPNNIDGFKEMVRLKSPDGKVGNWAYGHIPDFSSSWNWLMPVIDKIEEIDFDKNLGYSVTIVQFVCLIKRNSFQTDKQETIIDSPGPSKIEATWKGVVEFIKWHNGNL